MKKVLLTTCLLISVSVHAIEVRQEFSAQAIQTAPGRPVMQATMYVSKQAVRRDTETGGRKTISITYLDGRGEVLLLPDEKKYMRNENAQASKTNSASMNPCDAYPQARCKKIANETVNGRNTVKWEMIMQAQGRDMFSMHWIDQQTGLPVRQQFPDGSLVEMKLLGTEMLNGRQTDKWQVELPPRNGMSMSSYQWYDTQLNMIVREEFPGGFVRELINIKPGKQAAALFEIPAGFQQVELPAGQNSPANQATGR